MAITLTGSRKEKARVVFLTNGPNGESKRKEEVVINRKSQDIETASRIDRIAQAEGKGEEPLTYSHVTQKPIDISGLLFVPQSDMLRLVQKKRSNKTKLSMTRL